MSRVSIVRGALRGASALIAAVSLGALLAPPSVAAPTVTGAGSTWVQIALEQWAVDIAQQGLTINYQGVGSSSGRQFFIDNRVDFAASEIPFQPDEIQVLQARGIPYQYLPDVAGGTSFMYNLRDAAGNRITDLRLSADTVAKIFTGRITNWDDPAITADNGGRVLPSRTLIPVIRSDGSGTSAQLSLYLEHQAGGVWNQFLADYPGLRTPVSEWPAFGNSVAQRGSDGVANYVANDQIGQGSITYVEYGYAAQRGFPVAAVRNASGNFTYPTSSNVATALTHATLNADLTQNLGGVYTAPEPTAYPVSSYSYMITRTNGFDPAKGAVLGRWLIYIACDGQQQSAILGYSPLPPNLVKAVFDAIGRIPGAPAPPPIDQCNNPTIQAGGGGSSGAPPGTEGAPAQAPGTGATVGAGSTGSSAGAGSSGSAAGEIGSSGGPSSSGAASGGVGSGSSATGTEGCTEDAAVTVWNRSSDWTRVDGSPDLSAGTSGNDARLSPGDEVRAPERTPGAGTTTNVDGRIILTSATPSNKRVDVRLQIWNDTDSAVVETTTAHLKDQQADTLSLSYTPAEGKTYHYGVRNTDSGSSVTVDLKCIKEWQAVAGAASGAAAGLSAASVPGVALSAAEQLARSQAALELVSNARLATTLPLALAGAGVLGVVFGPFLLQRRREES